MIKLEENDLSYVSGGVSNGPCSGKRTCTVRAGENLTVLAMKNNTSVNAIMELNHINNINAKLNPGDTLILPD